MYHAAFVRWMAFTLLVLLVGCNSSGPGEPPPASDLTANIKAALQDVAATGQMGSGIGMIRSDLEMLKQTDEAKATQLLTDLDELERLSDPGKIKAKAKEMADKL